MFSKVLEQYPWEETTKYIYSRTSADVEQVLYKQHLSVEDFMTLVSPAAAPFLEQMAILSRQRTQERFGKVISLYVPLYITNSCTNHCVYCGFNHNNPIERIILTEEEIVNECKAIRRLAPFENILLVTGEDPRKAGVDYIEKALQLARPYFNNLSIEVMPLKTEDYQRLTLSGLNGVVCFQETYNRNNYKKYHPAGMKSNFEWRVNGFDRMGQAGVHKIGMGILIGLEEWRTDVSMMAIHLAYLRKKYWRTRYSINFPRMCTSEGHFTPNVKMSDRELAQLTFAFRLFDNDVDLSFSTRETPAFRNHIATLGATSMSAGSKTDPGGYFTHINSLAQFDVTDPRTPQEVADDIRAQGYEAVWKDWDKCFD